MGIEKEVLPGLPGLGGFSQTWYLTLRKTWPPPERVGSLIGECRAQAAAEPSSNWVSGGAACGRRTQETSLAAQLPGKTLPRWPFPGRWHPQLPRDTETMSTLQHVPVCPSVPVCAHG